MTRRGREAIDLSFQKWLAINLILKAAMASPQQNWESFLHLIFEHIGGAQGSVCAAGHCLTRFSDLN
jgi:hypothetical protein